MKRIISYLLVLAITLASFACTSKPKPNPFTPLQHELITAVITDTLDQTLKVQWVHQELVTALDAQSWVSDASLLELTKVYHVEVEDEIGDIYRLYASSESDTGYYLIALRKSDQQRFAYTIPKSAAEAFLAVLADYTESIQVLQYPLLSLTSISDPYYPVTQPSKLDTLSRDLNPRYWIRVDWNVPQETYKRFVAVDDQNTTYTFYEGSELNADYGIVVVDRADQSQLLFKISQSVLLILDKAIADEKELHGDDYYSRLLKAYVPQHIYLGSASSFDSSKLISLSTDVVELFQTYTEQYIWSTLPTTATIDTQAKLLFMTKSVEGLYLSVYAPQATYTDHGYVVIVSYGQDPFDGPNNDVFTLPMNSGMDLYRTLALSPIESSTALDIDVDTNATFSFPFFDMEFVIRTETFEGNLNSAMIDYLHDLQALDWTVSSIETVEAALGSINPFSLIITASNGTRYMIPTEDYEIIVDTDPTTPGALVYKVDIESMRRFGNPIEDLEFLAQFDSDLPFTSLKITDYRRFNVDTIDVVPFTNAQSDAISALFNASTLYLKTYTPFIFAPSPTASFKTSSGYNLSFYAYGLPTLDSTRFGLVLISHDDSLLNAYYMPIEEFTAIIDLYKSYLD